MPIAYRTTDSAVRGEHETVRVFLNGETRDGGSLSGSAAARAGRGASVAPLRFVFAWRLNFALSPIPT